MTGRMTKYQINRQLNAIFARLPENLSALPADDPDRIFLEEHPFPAIMFLAAEDRTEELARLIRAQLLPQQAYSRALKELQTMSAAFRILLTYPELAQQKRAAHKDGWESRLRRWGFDLGVARPSLRSALNRWKYAPDGEISVPGTDGITLFYPAETDPAEQVRGRNPFDYTAYLHMILHCLFGHIRKPEDVAEDIWNLASDIAAESLLTQFFPEAADDAFHAPGELPAGTIPTSAASVNRYLMNLSESDRQSLAIWYRRDDHRYWNGHDDAADAKPGAGGTGWEGLGASLQPGKKGSHHYGLAPGSREDKAQIRAEAQYDFSRYLRRFTTIREEIQLDMDSFDYIPYHYGLERYGNMPLIEPLETTEVSRIDTLAIAVDTSGSCSEETVQRFLAEIQRILMDKENFFRKMNVHIFQCDSMIQDHCIIHSPEEWTRYRDRLTIRGRGGTNFTPVFDRIGKLIDEGSLRDLKGLLYFTDGDGVYPREKPPYETAFVFTNRNFLNYKIPEWIIPLCLDDA